MCILLVYYLLICENERCERHEATQVTACIVEPYYENRNIHLFCYLKMCRRVQHSVL